MHSHQCSVSLAKHFTPILRLFIKMDQKFLVGRAIAPLKGTSIASQTVAGPIGSAQERIPQESTRATNESTRCRRAPTNHLIIIPREDSRRLWEVNKSNTLLRGATKKMQTLKEQHQLDPTPTTETPRYWTSMHAQVTLDPPFQLIPSLIRLRMLTAILRYNSQGSNHYHLRFTSQHSQHPLPNRVDSDQADYGGDLDLAIF